MRPIAPALTAAVLTLVGGCYDRKDQTPEAAPPPEPAPVLAGLARFAIALGGAVLGVVAYIIRLWIAP